MNDIETREDIEHLINTFYKQVVGDELIGHFFTEVVHLDWEVHIPVMYDFWQSILLPPGKYKGNPIRPHIGLDQKSEMLPKHFDRWVELWEETVSSLHAGEVAKEAIHRARIMSQMMQYKIGKSREGGFVQ